MAERSGWRMSTFIASQAPRCLKKKPRFGHEGAEEREQDAELERHRRVMGWRGTASGQRGWMDPGRADASLPASAPASALLDQRSPRSA